MNVLLEMRDIGVRFGATRALEGVNLDVRSGEILGLLGHNGSGKSTLLKVVAGINTPHSGTLAIRGESTALPLPVAQARQLGISFVHQELGLLQNLTVAENLWLEDIALRRVRPIHWRFLRERAEAVLQSQGLEIDLLRNVSELSNGQRAQLAIARARYLATQLYDGKDPIIMLDEPTVFLPRPDRERLFEQLRRMADQGAGVVLVTHDLDDVIGVTDRLVVLRDGLVTGVAVTRSTTRDDLVDMLVGPSLGASAKASDESEVAAPPIEWAEATSGAPVMEVSGLSGGAIADLSLEIYPGEIVGLTGLAGAGHSDVPYYLYGAKHADAGEVIRNSEILAIRSLSPKASLRCGVVLVPGNRLEDGLMPEMDAKENVAQSILKSVTKLGLVRSSKIVEHYASVAEDFGIHPREGSILGGAFSGGNQQKIVLAKWLQVRPKLLLADEPTQGVDVGTREAILDGFRSLARDGGAVLIASSDYRQLAELCSRVIVIRRGRAVSQLVADQLSFDAISRACVG